MIHTDSALIHNDSSPIQSDSRVIQPESQRIKPPRWYEFEAATPVNQQYKVLRVCGFVCCVSGAVVVMYMGRPPTEQVLSLLGCTLYALMFDPFAAIGALLARASRVILASSIVLIGITIVVPSTGLLVAVRNGKPHFYDPPELKEARAKLKAYLAPHRPDVPYEDGIRLIVRWCFPISGKHSNGEYRTTKPDTDNLQKMLKDVMTDLHFWRDDALVCSELAEKFWADRPGIYVRIEEI